MPVSQPPETRRVTIRVLPFLQPAQKYQRVSPMLLNLVIWGRRSRFGRVKMAPVIGHICQESIFSVLTSWSGVWSYEGLWYRQTRLACKSSESKQRLNRLSLHQRGSQIATHEEEFGDVQWGNMLSRPFSIAEHTQIKKGEYLTFMYGKNLLRNRLSVRILGRAFDHLH